MIDLNSTVITGQILRELLEYGYRNVTKNCKIINDLNVFPVPDGDTGTNMRITILNGLKHLKENGTVSEISDSFSIGTLFGARGNSGVLLSQYFKGVASYLHGKDEASVKELALSFQSGYLKAYQAAVEPTEGTILTVAREGIEGVLDKISDQSDLLSLFSLMVDSMRISLDNTPNLLPVLKESGVVDSGGKGLLCLFEGILARLQGKDIAGEVDKDDFPIDHVPSSETKIDFFNEFSVLDYGYCTEFILQLLASKTMSNPFDIQSFISWLKKHGSSLVCFQNDTKVKVHIHTKKPAEVIDYAQNFGEFVSFKMENMAMQHNELLAQRKEKARIRKDFAIVSIAQGDGIIDLFKELGSDIVINGGPSMNTSAAEMIEAFKEANAQTIFLLPNNENLLLTAKQAYELYKDGDVKLIMTTSIQQGYMALSLMINTSDCQEVASSLLKGSQSVLSYYVAKAIRDSKNDKVIFKDGEFVGGSGTKIIVSGKDLLTTSLSLVQSIPEIEDKESLFLIYGQGVDDDLAIKLKESLEERYPLMEIGLIKGNQRVYDILIGVDAKHEKDSD